MVIATCKKERGRERRERREIGGFKSRYKIKQYLSPPNEKKTCRYPKHKCYAVLTRQIEQTQKKGCG